MDDTLVRAALDLSGRPFLVWKVDFTVNIRN
jgi:imidazoleglycerol-phosphate dehydratase